MIFSPSRTRPLLGCVLAIIVGLSACGNSASPAANDPSIGATAQPAADALPDEENDVTEAQPTPETGDTEETVEPTPEPTSQPTPVPSPEPVSPPTPVPSPELVTPPVAKFTTFHVAPETAECVGVGPQTCLLIKTDPSADYEFFYDHIDGFEHVAGTTYELAVEVTERENPAADQSLFDYRLIRVLYESEVAAVTPEPPVAEFTTFYVSPTTVACVGVGPQTCLLIKTDPSADYEFFYDHIDGFEHVAGTTYELAVEVTERENPAADQSRFSYRLVRVLSQTEAPTDTVELSLAGSSWVVTRLNDLDPSETLVQNAQLTVSFDSSAITGSSGCNTFSGRYVLVGGDLLVEGLISTRKACVPDVMEQESTFLDRLALALHAEVVDDQLRITTLPGVILVLEPLPAAG